MQHVTCYKGNIHSTGKTSNRECLSSSVLNQAAGANLWLVDREQVDSTAPGLIPPQSCIVLQAIAGAILVDRQLTHV